MSDARCERTREIAAEIALGTASGDERAQALEHAASCLECRRLLLELSQVADEMLVIAPSHEPPPGFESRVLERLTSDGLVARRRPLRRALMAAAAVLLVAGASVAATLYLTRNDRRVGSYYRAALEEVNGDYFAFAEIYDMSESESGTAFAYEGHPSWMFCTVTDDVTPGHYKATIVTEDGELVEFGTFEVSADTHTWGKELPVHVRDIKAMRLIGVDDAQVLEADFDHS